jgi:hypothetical protein
MQRVRLLGVMLVVACGSAGGTGSNGSPVPRPVVLRPADEIPLVLSPNFTSQAEIEVSGLPNFVAQRRGSDDSSWYGVTREGGIAVFAQHDNHLAGMVQTAHQIYRVVDRSDGGYALVRVAHNQGHIDGVAPAASASGTPAFCSTPLASQAPSTVVDVLVMYTQVAHDEILKNHKDIGAQIKLAIEQANAVSSHSKVNVVFRIVGTAQTSDTENGYNAEAIASWLVAPCDNHFDDVVRQRDTYGADLAVLIADVKGVDVGWVADIALDPRNAFAVVDYHALDATWAFAHELGHLMGLRHDTDQSNTPCPDDHGFLHEDGLNNTWSDVMANDCGDGCEVQSVWSSPDLQHNGSPMGMDGVSNAARMLSVAAPIVAGYRDAPISPVDCNATSAALRASKR